MSQFSSLRLASALFVLLLTEGPALAREPSEIPNPRLKNSWIVDEGALLSVSEHNEINALINQTERQTGAEMVVVLLNTIGSKDPKTFAVDLFQQWGIGKKGADNGLLLLNVRDQRRVEVETGYGLEGVLPDVRVQQILRNEMVPHLKENKFGPAFLNGVRAFTRKIEATYDPDAPKPLPAPFAWLKEHFWLATIIYSIPLLFLLAMVGRILWVYAFQKELARLPEQIGGAALIYGIPALVMGAVQVGVLNLSFLYGGLVFGAGGLGIAAIRYWANTFRYKPRACPQCSQPMSRIGDPKEEFRFFNSAQAFEEKLEARDFDVWTCACGGVKIDEYEGRHSARFQRCRHCSVRAEFLSSHAVLRAATYQATGLEKSHFKCMACRNEREEEKILPMLVQSSSGSSGGSSSGSSSGGSFGGGRSGGGGSGSSY
jgi:uncharacterized protein